MITREEAIARIAAIFGEADPSRTPTVDLNQLADGPTDALFQPSLESRLADAWRAIESDGAAVTIEELSRHFPQYASLLLRLTVRSSDVPSAIGGFRILERVGGGGFGIVYKAWDDQLERYVAIKMPRRDKAAHLDVELYLKEARFLARLDHVGIVPVYFMDQTPDGQIYVVSKFIEGQDLEGALRKGRLGIRESVRLVTSVAWALEYAHQHGFVHRDIKPSNIMLGPEGEPVLVDFGLALRTAEFGTGPQWIGTPKYFSPEQARGEGHLVDGRSDIYSLGVVFYELLTGHVPFDVKNTAELLERIRTVEVQPLRQLDAGIPRELERICLKALAKRVAERYLTAGDLATDLQAWDASERGAVITADRGPSGRSQVPESAGSLAVLPKGLRSYDEADAGFFLQLVPGPRDRQGLPESIRFWKSRIESTDPSSAFRIGVLLGPTGSGKSSLIRAGLIPHLDSRQVHIILEESHPHELAPRLLRRLRRLGPMHDPPSSLRESLAYVREGGGLSPDRKLLLVLDQFEQWLAESPGEQANDLLEGLRQCDGTRVQALLLVRDDFTLATTAFMQQLDEVLHQNRNFAVQSPFGEPHARQVLSHFGRAFGQLPEGPLNGEQTSFLQEAVKDLAQDGQLVPIQLAIFAEMVKDKPWRPATLHRSGGTRGVGIAFLQDVVTGPQLRPHLQLVRRVLETLLPEPGQLIKGSPIPRSQLEAAVGPDSRKALDQVLEILDTNLKIVAKVGDASGSSLGSSSRDFELRYQLTHDFLVPTIREWLALEERSTRRGRARRRLQELASSYKVSQDPRHLPRFGEWLTIRLLTSSWSDAEQSLMKRADRQWLTGAAVTLLFVAILTFSTREVQRRVAANTLFTELSLASPQQLPEAVNQVLAQRRSVEPRLRQERQRLNVEPIDDGDSKRWNLAVALACLDDDSELTWLLDRLSRLSPDELLIVSQLLQRRRTSIADQLAARVESELLANDPQLHAAAMLAQMDSDHACWRACGEQLARHLASVPVTEAAEWGNLFLPLKETLTPQLIQLWQDPVDLSAGERTNLLVLLSRYAASHSAQWATMLRYARPEELKGLLEKTGDQREAVRQALTEPWNSLTAARAAKYRDASDSAVSAVAECLQAYSGECNSSGAFACTIPRDEFDRVDGVLRDHGFRIDTVRPYHEPTGIRIAATWRRESIPTRWEWNRSVPEIETLHKQLASSGWQVRDFSRSGPGEGTNDEPRFSVLWIKPPDPVESRIALAISRDAYLKIRKAWDDDGLSYERYDAWSDQTGNRQYGLIGTREYDNEEVRTFLVDYSLADFYDPRLDPGVRFPGASQGDCRLSLLPMTLDRFTLTQRIDFRRQEVESELRRQRQAPGRRSKELATTILQLVDILLRAGAHDEAGTWLTKLPESFGEHPTTIVMQGTLAARQGRVESVEQAVERYEKVTNKPGLLALLKLRASILRNDVAGAQEHLQAVQRELPAGASTTASSITLEILARAYAAAVPLMSSHDPDFAKHCRRQAISQLKQWYQEGAGTEPEINLQDVEFDAIRGEPEFKALVQTLQIDQRANSVWHELPGYQTRLVTGVSAEDHLRAANQRLQLGDLPVCVECQISPEDHQLRIMSVWQESLPTPDELARRNRELASLALASAALGDRQRLREVFSDQHGQSARTEAIEIAHRVLSPSVLMSFLRQTDPDEVGLQRSIVLALGGFTNPARSPEEAACREQLENLARSQSDTGLRAAAEWCLRRWGSSIAAATGQGAGSSVRPWTTDSLGRRMIRVNRKEPFLMGAAPGELGKGGSEMRHWARIDHDFLLAESEVTVKDFQAYLNDPRIQDFYSDEPPTFTRRFAPTDDCPIISLSIEDAARFCEWLSEKELPPSEWCYPNLLSDDQPFVRPPDYLQRSGYRLPTEMEWELACRAGSDASRFYGESSTCLSSYAWYAANAQGRVHPVKSLRPNDWGFFDMLGNAREWCFDIDAPYHLPFDGIVRTMSPSELPRDFGAENFPARGGSLVSDTGELRAASRKFAPPRQHAVSLGFRYARTYRTSRAESSSATSD